MTLALQIFRHAIAMIFASPLSTLRAVAPGGVVSLIGGVMLMQGIGNAPVPVSPLSGELLWNLPLVFAGAFLVMVGGAAMIVTWHRYVLLDTARGEVVPPARVILRYMWVFFLLSLIAVLVIAVLMLPLSFVVIGGGSEPAVILGAVVVTVFVSWLGLLLSLPLPAAAIGQRLRFRDSYAKTVPHGGTILTLVIGVSLLTAGMSVLPAYLLPVGTIVSRIAELMALLLTVLVNASILTTLYGWLVEGRALNG